MQNVLRDIVLSLGILLGIIRTEDPVLTTRVFRDDRAIYLNLEVARAFPKDAVSLLESGNDLTLAFIVEAKGYGSFRFSHEIRYNPISQEFTVTLEETGNKHLTKQRDAALDIASRIFGYHLLDISDFDSMRGLDVFASCVLEVPGMDATIVWNYRNPEARASFKALSGIPR
jgi:hypothetical protein